MPKCIPSAGGALICASLLTMAASPAQATGVLFTLDENLSSITLTMSSGSSTSNTEVLHLSGDFTLDLSPAAVGSWDGSAAFIDVLAGSYDGPVTLSIPFVSLEIDSLGLTGIDMTIPSSPATLSGGPGISSGTQYGVGTFYEVQGYATTIFGNGPVDFTDTAITDWTIQVSDPATLGIPGAGNVAARLEASFTTLVPPTTGLYISADIVLAGTGSYLPAPTPVPLPGALLLMLSGLAGFVPSILSRRRNS